MFGIAVLVSKGQYFHTAIAVEDSLIYSIEWDVFSTFMETYPKVALFFASGFASGVQLIESRVDQTVEAHKALLGGNNEVLLFREDDVVQVNPKRSIVTCSIDTSIREAAQIMSKHRVGSIIIIDGNRYPVGIVTDTDFRRTVVSQAIDITQSISTVMSSPVVTIESGLTIAEIILMMMRLKIRHLCVTEDGTINSRVLGIISEHDLLLLHGNNPAVLVKEIFNTRDVSKLALIRNRADELVQQYLRQGISIAFISGIITQINDALIHQAISLAEDTLQGRGLVKPNIAFCWLSMGSEGRGEQLLRTDQDNALLFDDFEEDSTEEYRQGVQQYFIELAKEVNGILETCGFELCPANMMARNSQWCCSLHSWVEKFRRWITVPDGQELMNATIFFDMRMVYGSKELIAKLHERVSTLLQQEPRFFVFLAKNALQNPPPLSFFRGFMVEKSGKHENEFDIKARAMMPITDAVRVLALEQKILFPVGTLDRLRRLSELLPDKSSELKEISMAYQILLRFRTVSGFQQNSSGRFLNPEKLNKIERQSLRNTFTTIDRAQKMIANHFQTDLLR
jgi:CBS domain-containing protein